MHKCSFVDRVLSVLLALCICTTICIIDTSADSQSNQRAMIKYFENQGASAIGENITEADLRLFGLFISNFYTPYETVIDTSGNSEESNFTQVVRDVCAFLLGYADTESMSTENTEIADKFAASIITTVQQTSKQLKLRVNGVMQEGGVTWTAWLLHNTDKVEMLDDLGNVWFTFDSSANSMSKSAFCDMATMIALSAGDDAAKAYLTAEDNEQSVKMLYVDAFGDIIDGQGTVIIPACINPYTYTMDGSKLPINNAFYMGGLLSSLHKLEYDYNKEYSSLDYSLGFMDGAGDNDALLMHLKSGGRTSVLSPYICTLRTTYGNRESTTSFENGGSFTSKAQTRMIVQAYGDLNSTVGNFFTKFLNIGNGKYDNAIKSRTKHVETVSENVIQDVYIINKNTAGTFDFSNAVKQELFTATKPEDAFAEATNLSDIGQASVLWNPGYQAYLKDITTGNSYDVDDFILVDDAEAVHNHVYYYDYAIEDIGRQLTTAAGTSGKLQKADRLNLWAEIFYAYMMYYDQLNPNLPSVVVTDALSTALTSITGTNLTDDALNKQNAELANKLMKRMMVFTNEGRNEEKGNLVIGFVDSFLLGLHRSMLGLKSTDIANVSNADNRMFGFVSPVSIPSLSEVPITSQILEYYRTIYAVLFIIAVVAALFLLLLRLRTATEVIATVLLTAFCLLIPQTLLDSVIQLTNTAVDKLYSDRFTYWALIQHQQDLREEAEATAAGVEDYDTSVTKAFSDVSAYYNASDGIQLRWMAAKKGNNFSEVTGNSTVSETTIPGLNTFKWLFSGYLKQESYSGDPMATYVYRTYASLADAAKTSYDNINGMTAQVRVPNNTVGFTPQTGNSEYTSTSKSFYKTVPLASSVVTDAINNSVNATSLSGGLTIGTTPDAYEEAWIYLSESPYYYFYNVLKTECGEGENFLNNFLSDNVYKTTTDGQAKGALKDFLDLEGLCTNVIPYMTSANAVVNTWVERYGITPDNYKGNGISDEQINKMWNLYCPWVDSLYDLDCAADTVTVWNETIPVADAFNPSYYYDVKTDMGRQMIFSESERIIAGVNGNDLTTVERKLLQVTTQTYEDLRYLANYAQFDSEAVITAAAMAATFNFNRVFSETSVTGDGITLYPQGYELKTFNLDAYLRLILLNNTGTSVFSTTDIYETVLDDGGCLAGLGLVLYDVIALWLLPTAKLLIVLLTFCASLLFAGYLILQKPQKILALAWKDLIMPPVIFGLVTTAYAGVVALLMGNGLDLYVGSRTGSFVTNSIGVTIFTLIIVSLVLVFAYWKLVKTQVKDIIAYGAIVKDSVKAVVSEIGHAVSSVASGEGKATAVGASTVLSTAGATKQAISKVNAWDAKRKANSKSNDSTATEDVAGDTKENGTTNTESLHDTTTATQAEVRANRAAQDNSELTECSEHGSAELEASIQGTPIEHTGNFANTIDAAFEKANNAVAHERELQKTAQVNEAQTAEVTLNRDAEQVETAEKVATENVKHMQERRSVKAKHDMTHTNMHNETDKLVTTTTTYTNAELKEKVSKASEDNEIQTVDTGTVAQAETDAKAAVQNAGLQEQDTGSTKHRG